MSFTTPCFIRLNTNLIRDNLYNLGYTHIYREDDNHRDFILCYEGNFYLHYKNNYVMNHGHPLKKKGSIDCGTSTQLFLAIAALNDDTDYMQWFTNGEDFILCDRDDWVDMYSVLCSGVSPIYIKSYMKKLDKYHKATVPELIDHLKPPSYIYKYPIYKTKGLRIKKLLSSIINNLKRFLS